MIAALKSSADPAATASQPDKTYTGTIATVDPKERVLDVKGSALSSKRFNLSDNCTYTIVGKDAGSLDDLHPGLLVTVSYHINNVSNVSAAVLARQELRTGDLRSGSQRIQINNYYYTNDVFVADRVQQELMTCETWVRTNDLTHHTLILRFPLLNRTFQIPDDCKIMLYDGKSGAITDIQPNNYVRIIYETPGSEDVAHEITQTNTTFRGKLMTINRTNQTLTANTLFDSKEFHLADNCAIMVNGKTNAQLSDLKLFDKFVFSYNNINGVNLVSLITTNIPPPHSIDEKSLRTQALSPRMREMSPRALSPRMQSTQ